MPGRNDKYKPALIASDAAQGLSRRALLRTTGSAALLPLLATSCAGVVSPEPQVLEAGLNATLDAFANRIIPADEFGPGAGECGVSRYVNRSLADWNRAELPQLSAALRALDGAARARHGRPFVALEPAEQDSLMLAMEQGTIADFANSQQLFNRLHRLVLEGMFSDPYYGGNANFAGWDLIGYPGAVPASTPEMQAMGGRLPALHTSAYGAEHDGH